MAAAKMNARTIVVWIFGAAEGLRDNALMEAAPTIAITSEGPRVARMRIRANVQRCMRYAIRPRELSVGLTAMGHRDNLNALRGIINQIENPIIAHPQSIRVMPLQFLDADRTRIVFEGKEFALHTVKHVAWHAIQLVFRRTLEYNLIIHGR